MHGNIINDAPHRDDSIFVIAEDANASLDMFSGCSLNKI